MNPKQRAQRIAGLGLGILWASLALAASPAAAQQALACEVKLGACDVVLEPNAKGEMMLEEGGKPVGRLAGKTVCLRSGEHRQFWAKSLQGRPDAPVKITNCGGQVTFKAPYGNAVSFENSRYVRLTGTGEPATRYGIVAHVAATTDKAGHAVEVSYGSSDFEIDHIEAKGNPLSYDAAGKPVLNGIHGISFKTYPRCSDRRWERGSFAQYNTIVRDNYVHDIQYEGLYIGPSRGGWIEANSYKPGTYCKDGPFWLIEADLINVEVLRNRVENTGSDAIQIGNSLQRTEVKNNRVNNFGVRSEDAHSSAIQIGSGTTAVVDANWLENPAGATRKSQGVKFMGLGGSLITNNVIIGAANGLQLLRNTDVNLDLNLPDTHIYNNTVIGSTAEAMYLLCGYLRNVHLKNNIFAGYSSPYLSGNGGYRCVPALTTANLFFDTVAAAGFVDAAAQDYRPRAGSLAAGSGSDLSAFFQNDFDGRPRNGVFQLGAYQSPPPQSVPQYDVVDVNFTTARGPFGAAPWNNFAVAYPGAGQVLRALVDRSGKATPYAIHISNAFAGARGEWGAQDGGVLSGNDSGAVPDAVSGGLWYVQANEARIVLSGLNMDKRYMLQLFGSRAGTGSKPTTYSAGALSGTLDASNNVRATVTLGPLEPSAGGVIEITVKAGAGAPAGYLNALRLSEH